MLVAGTVADDNAMTGARIVAEAEAGAAVVTDAAPEARGEAGEAGEAEVSGEAGEAGTVVAAAGAAVGEIGMDGAVEGMAGAVETTDGAAEETFGAADVMVVGKAGAEGLEAVAQTEAEAQVEVEAAGLGDEDHADISSEELGSPAHPPSFPRQYADRRRPSWRTIPAAGLNCAQERPVVVARADSESLRDRPKPR